MRLTVVMWSILQLYGAVAFFGLPIRCLLLNKPVVSSSSGQSQGLTWLYGHGWCNGSD